MSNDSLFTEEPSNLAYLLRQYEQAISRCDRQIVALSIANLLRDLRDSGGICVIGDLSPEILSRLAEGGIGAGTDSIEGMGVSIQKLSEYGGSDQYRSSARIAGIDFPI